jgi:hypothetical protein
MHLGRYGTIVGVVIGLVAAGAGMVWPENPYIGWALLVFGGLLFVVSTVWGTIAWIGAPRRSAANPAAIGDITINARDGNRIGNIGHTIQNRNRK